MSYTATVSSSLNIPSAFLNFSLSELTENKQPRQMFIQCSTHIYLHAFIWRSLAAVVRKLLTGIYR